ncbi:MAG: capsular biosynthesis protein [Clostridium sulfidigenes]|uniref:Capsular biosynthesis protein n=1 Tax=Clostridium sulfidigenes TaxID=318464 RepID=A0A927WAC4_9CLOT|nr:capsular biosynthesis protein [Clostridium sulfidigenes]
MEEQVISLGEILEVLKKRWKLILIVTLLATLVSGLASFFLISPKYEASTKLFIGKEAGAEAGYDQNEIGMYQKLMKTYSEAIKTRDLVGRAIKVANSNLTEDEVLKKLTVVTVADTQILQIKIDDKDPNMAATMVQAITNEFVTTSKALVPNGNIKVIETVKVPEIPVSPNKKMNIAIAFLLGLMVSVGVSFLLEFLDNTYKNREQLEKELDIPVIGTIPYTEQ